MNLLFRNFWNTLRRYKTASILNVLGLSVAFAAFAIIMMQVRYDLTYDKFHSHYETIYQVQTKFLNEDGSDVAGFPYYMPGLSMPIVQQLESFSPDILAVSKFDGNKTQNFKTHPDQEDYPFRESVSSITPGTLNIFDFPIVAGDTARFGQPNTALIPESMAEKLFPGQSAVGGMLYQSGTENQAREIIGVYRDFPVNSYLKNKIYVRKESSPADDNVNMINGTVFIRLSSAEKKEEVEQSMLAQIKRVFGNETSLTFRIVSLHDVHYGNEPGDGERINTSRTYLFLGIGILIIVIAMINFINFSTSLVPARLKSVNTRKVMGQSNTSIRIGMIFEAFALCLVSVVLAVWIVYFLSTTSFSGLLSADMKWGANVFVLLITITITVGTGILAGVYPAWYITSFPSALVLKGSFALSPKGRRLRTFLISFQYTVSFALIIVAVFMHVQHTYMQNYPMGYNRENVLTFNLNSNLGKKRDAVKAQLLQHPDIKAVGFMQGALFSEGGSRSNMELNGQQMFFDVKRISPGFLEVFGIELLEGRDFNETDGQKEFETYIVNETAQKRYRLKAGEVLTVTSDNYKEYEARPAYEVAGIIRDFNYKPLREEIEPIALALPVSDNNNNLRNVYLKVNSNNYTAVMDFIRSSLQQLDPAYTDYDIRFFDETIGNFYKKEAKLAKLITLFSLLAIIISLIGVFGLVLFETQYRRKEIGLRRINGATIPEILRMLNTGFVRIVLVCFMIAAPISFYATTKWLEEFAYKSPMHWWIFAISLLSILFITLLTVTLQSYRAATENPVNSIKTE